MGDQRGRGLLLLCLLVWLLLATALEGARHCAPRLLHSFICCQPIICLPPHAAGSSAYKACCHNCCS